MKIVKITWFDAQRIEAQRPVPFIDDFIDARPLECSIVGYLIFEDKDGYLIAQEYWEETKQIKYIHIIPKCSVKKVEVLKEKK